MYYKRKSWIIICAILSILFMTFQKNNWDISILLYIIVGLIIVGICISVVYTVYLNKTPTINKCPKCNTEYSHDIFYCPNCKTELKQIKIKKL